MHGAPGAATATPEASREDGRHEVALGRHEVALVAIGSLAPPSPGEKRHMERQAWGRVSVQGSIS